MDKLKIQYLNPKDLIPYANNHKIHGEDQINRLANIISEFGVDQPLVVDKNMVIIKGHGRREAAIKIGLKQIPVVVADHLDEHQVKAARIADNKISSNEYNYDALRFDVGTLALYDFNLNLTGLDELELADLKIDGLDLNSEQFDMINREITNQEKQNTLGLANNENQNFYTDKIQTPIYEPVGEKPDIKDLIDSNKYKSLLNEIEKSNLSNEEKEFLMFAASRHIVFNYEKVANYYAHSAKTLQELFENSALVIIDFDKAVENGFVRLSNEMNESYLNNEDDDE